MIGRAAVGLGGAMAELSSGLSVLRQFFDCARGQPQETIIIEFLEAVRNDEDVVEGGSVLITDDTNKRLVVFNTEELVRRNLVNVPRSQLPPVFPYIGSTAGLCLRSGRSVIYSKSSPDRREFGGESPIENMICIPIDLGDRRPFGVVCFHNNVPEKKITAEHAKLLEAYVDALALALHTPHPELQLENNIFIVHGHETALVNELKAILYEYGATPKVLWSEDKNATPILVALEDLVRTCRAGFVLMTPDDEGRKIGDAVLTPRARENVIFETGLLFARFRRDERVCVLRKKPTSIPSDLNGISFEDFDSLGDIKDRIWTKLMKWGVHRRQ
jgi:predicted nucleotide-binding protein